MDEYTQMLDIGERLSRTTQYPPVDIFMACKTLRDAGVALDTLEKAVNVVLVFSVVLNIGPIDAAVDLLGFVDKNLETES